MFKLQILDSSVLNKTFFCSVEKKRKNIVCFLRDNINIIWELRCLLNLSCADSSHGEEAGWMYWEAGEFVRKWCYTLLSGGEEAVSYQSASSVLCARWKEGGEIIFYPGTKHQLDRWQALPIHNNTHFSQDTDIVYCDVWKKVRRSLTSRWPRLGPQPLYWLPVPEKWHILSHFKASKSDAFLVKMRPLSTHTY